MLKKNAVSQGTATHYSELIPELGIICQSLYIIFHQPPTSARLDMLDSFTLAKNYFSARGNNDALQSLAILAESCSPLDDSTLHTLAADYQQLFIGPQDLSAPPWGSVYLHPNKEMFDDSTVEVDNFYRRYGLQLDTGMNEPADHIGLMFAFMAWLFSRDLEERYNGAASGQWQSVLRDFVGGYLLPWSGHFLELMRRQASTRFYQQVATLTQAVIDDIADYSGAVRKPAVIY